MLKLKQIFLAILMVLFHTNLYSLDLNNPYGIATNGNYLYIADTGNCRIVRCNLDGSNPLSYGSVGRGNEEFVQPQGIGVTPNGDIYVVDTGNHRIQKLKDNGTTISFVKVIGSEGQGIGQFSLPRDIAIDFRNGYFLVCDSLNQRISKFSLDGNPINSFSGSNSFGEWGTQTGKLWHPYGIALDNQGNIYVADTYNHRIQKFSPAGVHLLSFGVMGQDNGQFAMPQGVVVDSEGYILAIDTENHRVCKFSPQGEYMESYGKYRLGKGGLLHPQKGVIAQDGNLYVIDSTGKKFETFNIGTYITSVSCLPSIFSPNNDGTFDNTTISYSIPEQARITVNIYDSNGALVKNLVDANRTPGGHSEIWNGKDNGGVIVPDSKYTYIINAVNSLNYHAPQKKGEVNVDNTSPAITNLEVIPNVITTGKQITLRACIADNISGIGSVTINLSSIGGPSNQVIYGDYEFYTYQATVSTTTSLGTKTLNITAKDRVGNLKTEEIILFVETPLTTPIVIDEGEWTTNTTKLSANWVGSDSESGIVEYQYCIGTTKGGTDTVNWRSAGIDTSTTETGLNLSEGKTYYFTVKAKNGAGLWSNPGYSDGITVDKTPPVITNPKATPDTVSPGGQVKLTAYITDNIRIGSVFINLSSISGALNQQMFDDGTNGDEKAQDGIYTFAYTIPNSVLPGTKTLTIIAKDNAKNLATATIILTIPSCFILGKVTVGTSETSIKGIDIEVFKNNILKGSATTDSNGMYRIENLPFESYYNFMDLRVSKDKMLIQEKTIIAKEGENIYNLNLPDYICGGTNSLYIGVDSWGETSRIFYLYPSDPSYKIATWSYTIHRTTRGRDDGSYIDYNNNCLVIKVKLGGGIGVCIKYNYIATYYIKVQKPTIDLPSQYGGNNSSRISDSATNYIVKTYYLYPSDPKYKIYKWDYEVNKAYFAYDAGTYIDSINNRLVIKVKFMGWTWKFLWFRRYRIAYYDATYYVWGRLPSSDTKTPSMIPLTLVEEKEVKTKPKVIIQRSKTLGDEMKVTIALTDIEDVLTEVRMDIFFDPTRVSIEKIEPPVFENEVESIKVQENGTPAFSIYLNSEIDTQNGKANIEEAIVLNENIYEEERVYNTGTLSSSMAVQALEKEDTEEAFPIANLFIKLKSSSQAMSLENSFPFSIQSCELKNIEGETIEPDIEQPEAKPQIPSKTELLQSFPNPAKDGLWIPFKLANDADVSLAIYNILGQKVKTISVGERKAGVYTQAKQGSAIFWDQRNEKGQPVSSGLYFYKIHAGGFSSVKSMIVK